MKKAIIFDLDGTLADTIPAITEGINRAMRRLGYPDRSEEEIRSFINHGARHLIRCAIPREYWDDDKAIDHALEVYNQSYGEVVLLTDRTYDGMRELVEKLHTSYKIGVLSNKQDIYVKQLSHVLLGDENYDAAQGVAPGHPTKPHPYLPQKIAAELGVATEDCIMIGDSDIDLLTAEGAGMTHIAVTWGFRSEEFLLEKGAKNLAHNIDELEELIQKNS